MIGIKRNFNFKLGIDHFWIISVLVFFGFIVSLTPVPPNDFWWHLKIGQIISTTRSIPSTNMFAWSLSPDAPFTYAAWFGDLLFYAIYKLGGVATVIFINTIIAIVSFGLIGFEAWRRSRSWRLAGLVLVLAAIMSSNNTVVRPQILSWIPFMITYILLSAFADGRIRPVWLLLCPVIMVFWVNIHGSFILGIALIGIFLVGEVIRRILKLEGARSWKEIGWIGGIGILSALSALINPEFTGIFRYVAHLMTDKSSQRLIEEWQPPAPTTIATIVFFASILFLMFALVYSRYYPTPTEALLIIAFTWLAWTGLRYVIWYAMVVMPILARVLRELLGKTSWLAVPRRSGINTGLALLFMIPLVIVQPWFVESIPLPQKYWNLVHKDSPLGPLLSVSTPLGAVEYLRENPGGHLFNEMGYGSYMIWAYPEQGVFVDPRVELYPYDQWLDYIKISNGVRYNELLDKYRIDRILLDNQEQAELSGLLANDELWRMEYSDQYSQIWGKKEDKSSE